MKNIINMKKKGRVFYEKYYKHEKEGKSVTPT